MIALLRSLTALEGKVLERGEPRDENPLTHHQDALQQALRDDDRSTL